MTISKGWMMQVAPMPDKPPLRNGFTAFHVELSARDMFSLGFGACGDVLREDRSDRGAFSGGASKRRREISNTSFPGVTRRGRGEVRGEPYLFSKKED